LFQFSVVVDKNVILSHCIQNPLCQPCRRSCGNVPKPSPSIPITTKTEGLF